MGSWHKCAQKATSFDNTGSSSINFSFSGLFQSTIIDGEVTFFHASFGLTGAAKINQNIKK